MPSLGEAFTIQVLTNHLPIETMPDLTEALRVGVVRPLQKESFDGYPRRIMMFAAGLCAALALVSSSAIYQSSSAIEGTVSDPSGAVIPNAEITLRNVETGIVRSVTTSNSGYYRFPELPVALYEVSAAAKGFTTTVQQNVRLEVA